MQCFHSTMFIFCASFMPASPCWSEPLLLCLSCSAYRSAPVEYRLSACFCNDVLWWEHALGPQAGCTEQRAYSECVVAIDYRRPTEG